MEPITLCGAVIVMFGLWVEFEPSLKKVARFILNSRLFKEFSAHSRAQRPVYGGRLPICLAKSTNY